MHLRFLLVVALAVALAVPTVTGAPIAGQRLLEDPAGDALVTAKDTAVADPTNPSNDLRFLDIEEEVDGFRFTIGVAALERPGGDVSPEANQWTVLFRHGAQAYRLVFIWGVDGGWRTDMYRIDASGAATKFSDAAIDRDMAAGTVSSFVERDLLRDEHGAPPMGGASFNHFRVIAPATTFNDFVNGGSPLVGGGDSMPDAGPSTVPYAIAWGATSDGPVAMTSPLPFRTSNGAATTYLFELQVENLDEVAHRYFFRTPMLPAGWSARFPADGLWLEAGANRTVPVLVSLPFAHQHGDIERTVLELEADAPGIVARTEIGVLFLETPQPSGHHPTVWLHSREQVLIEDAGWHFTYTPGADVYMNADEEDAGDAGLPIRGYAYEDGYEWYVFLEPGLLTGLDFRAGETADLVVPIDAPRPLPQASLGGSLVLLGPETNDSYDDRPGTSATGRGGDFGGREQTVLGTLVPTPAADLSGHADYSTTITFPADLDLVPPVPGQTLLLRLRLDGSLPAAYEAEPTLVPGGSLTLPLDEYADPIDTTFLSSAVQLVAASAQERSVNPGGLLVLAADVTNPGDAAMDVGLELSGQGSAWATLHGPATRHLDAGATVRVEVVLQVPEDAEQADRADLVLEAFDAQDPTLRSLVRFVAHVDTSQVLEDDSGLALTDVGQHSAPMSPLGLTLALLAALVLGRRRPARTGTKSD